jgi:hypothetical protein
LLNDARLNAGKSPLGFLNPMLYKAKSFDASAFYGSLSPICLKFTVFPFLDVTVGTNRCGTIDFQPSCCERGFVASPGNYTLVLAKLLSLANKKKNAQDGTQHPAWAPPTIKRCESMCCPCNKVGKVSLLFIG